MRNRILTLLISAVMISSIALSAADAGAFSYSTKRRRINCAVIMIPGVNGSEMANHQLSGLVAPSYNIDTGKLLSDPGTAHIFWKLDNDSLLKPAGWSLQNPLSNITVATDYGKFNDRYWVLNLDSITDLTGLDVAYLPLSGYVELTDMAREKLRRFVDTGGVLWIDFAGGSMLDFDNTFFIRDMTTVRAGGTSMYPAGNRYHPILSSPNWLDEREIPYIGWNAGSYSCNPGFDIKNMRALREGNFNFDSLLPITVNSADGRASIAGNTYGSGKVVMTADFVGMGIIKKNDFFSAIDMKLGYNILAWSSSWTEFRKGARRTASGIDSVGGGKLVETWTLPAPALSRSEVSPVVYKGVAFYTADNGLYAVDLLPNRDLDGDGDVDDGVKDSTLGMENKGQDVIWYLQSPPGIKISAPTVVSMLNVSTFNGGTGNPVIDAVLITMNVNGSTLLRGLFAFPTDGNGHLAGNYEQIPYIQDAPLFTSGGSEDFAPRAPIYQNGWIYYVSSEGKLNAFNPVIVAAAGYSDYAKYSVPFTSIGSTYLGAVKSAPFFGYVKNETTGATLGMVYWVTPDLKPSGVQRDTDNDCIYGIPVSVAGDKLKVTQRETNTWYLETSYKTAFISENPAISIWFRDRDGDTHSIDDYCTVDINEPISGTQPQPGRIKLTFKSGMADKIDYDATIYASYSMYYRDKQGQGGIVYMSSPTRTVLTPSSSTGEHESTRVPKTEVVGTPAMGPDNTIYISGHRSDGYANSVYAVKNMGTGEQITRWNYMIHNGVSAGDANGVELPPVIIHKDTETGNVYRMENPQLTSSPTYAGGTVFVTVSGDTNGNAPRGALLCLNANHNFTIRVTKNAGTHLGGSNASQGASFIDETTGRHKQVRIWQPNILENRNTPGQQLQPAQAAVGVPSDMIDYNNGIITITNFERIKLRGTMSANGRLTPSLPVHIFIDNVEVPVDYSTWAPTVAAETYGYGGYAGQKSSAHSSDCVDLSGWNNLLWYYVIPDSTISSPPVVIGNTVYVMADNGDMYALNAETGESNATETTNKPVWQWNSGSTSGSGDQYMLSPAASDGVLLVPTKNGLTAFGNSYTLVADDTRVAEIDGGGDLAWMADTVRVPATIPASKSDSTSTVDLNITGANMAKYLEGNDMLLVCTGGNYVCRIDKSAEVSMLSAPDSKSNNVTRYIRWFYDKFTDPKNLLASGGDTALRHPTDAQIWSETETAGGKQRVVVHCLIADSGNYRIVDLVYRFDTSGNIITSGEYSVDPSTGFVLPELNWVTKTDATDQKFTFNSVQLGEDNTSVWAAASNYRTGTDTDITGNYSVTDPMYNSALGGAIVAVKYREGTNGAWNYNAKGCGEIFARCDALVWSGNKETPILNPRFFKVVNKTDGTHLLVCDNNGIHYTAALAGGTSLRVTDSLTDERYRSMYREIIDEKTGVASDTTLTLGIPLRASCVELLPNGNWLVTNGYVGVAPDGGNFSGEVFEYDPESKKIVWTTPELMCPENTPEDWYQATGGTKLNHPRSALRR
ncbi:MAG: PQQ-binding-like beta-propeller repeat protein [Abditibacteriota bacterium]|nr:PQQ-binding-like beta-propeller repeat protein [Abditibacteriota bacterium]